jgi:hypothetical protein
MVILLATVLYGNLTQKCAVIFLIYNFLAFKENSEFQK